MSAEPLLPNHPSLSLSGVSLEQGDEVPSKLQPDVDAVIGKFIEAAEAGYVEALHALGGMYNTGYMVEKDDEAGIGGGYKFSHRGF